MGGAWEKGLIRLELELEGKVWTYGSRLAWWARNNSMVLADESIIIHNLQSQSLKHFRRYMNHTPS
jgi:predicted NAD/FAD-dependent oxidoreductase